MCSGAESLFIASKAGSIHNHKAVSVKPGGIEVGESQAVSGNRGLLSAGFK